MLRGTEVAGKGCDALHSSFEARGLPRPEASQERSGNIRRLPRVAYVATRATWACMISMRMLAHATINATAWCAPKIAVHTFSWITHGITRGGTCGAHAIWPAFGPHTRSAVNRRQAGNGCHPSPFLIDHGDFGCLVVDFLYHHGNLVAARDRSRSR